jgi:rubrerythrin
VKPAERASIQINPRPVLHQKFLTPKRTYDILNRMQEEAKTHETFPPEVHDVMRSLVSAIRAVKLYPPNNPIYSQSVKKSHEALSLFLKTTSTYPVGVQKTYFTYGSTPVGKDTQLNKPIAQDLFAKGIREMVFSEGVTEGELLVLLQSLAQSSEELGLKSGIGSILWERDAVHIKVTEAGLGEVITVKSGEAKADAQKLGQIPVKDVMPSGRTLVLNDLMSDPEGFGAGMVEAARRTRGEHESVEDRLFALYQEAGRTIREKHPGQSDAMFENLAQSALSLEAPLRDGLVGGKLYGDFDAETANEQKAELEEHVPNELHEILTGRFSNVWNVKQVTVLLKKSSSKKTEQYTPPPSPLTLAAVPIPPDLNGIALEMGEYTPEEMEALKDMGEMGQDADIVEAAARTLIFLLLQVKNPYQPVSEEQEVGIFSGIVRQLEDMLSYLLKQKDYDLASLIFRAFHMPVDPIFKPRLEEAIRKMASKTTIAATISDMRTFTKGSPQYRSAYGYLSIFESETTEVLLELLAEEEDRSVRVFLLEIVKDLGKNQFQLLSGHLFDHRWFVVRNVVSILGESKSEQALPLLQKVADHKDVRIRQEVIKALVSVGGKKAAGLLEKFLKDHDDDIQGMAIRSFGTMTNIGAEESRYLTAFLEDRPLKKKEQDHTLEAIKALSKIGGRETGDFLKRYTRIRWWKPRKIQLELRIAAQHAMEEIKRRQGNGGSAAR